MWRVGGMLKVLSWNLLSDARLASKLEEELEAGTGEQQGAVAETMVPCRAIVAGGEPAAGNHVQTVKGAVAARDTLLTETRDHGYDRREGHV